MGFKFGLFGGRGETRKEVWVRILGLPISLWVPSVLRRVGDACGGFLDVDSQTESLEELQWARILVRSDGETFPDILELGIEETTYSVTLWWEMMPSIRLGEGRKQGLWSRPRREVGGDEDTRASSRVEQLVGAGTEAQRQSEDGTGRLSQDVGSAVKRAQAQLGLLQGSGSKSRPLASGMCWAYGPKLPTVCEAPKGDQIGPGQSSSLGRAAGYGMGHSHKGKYILAQPHILDNGLLLKALPSCSNGQIKDGNLEREFTKCREEEMGRRQQPNLNNPRAKRMLEEEAARYDSEVNMGGARAQGSSSSNLFCFGRTPEREYYDHSGVRREGILAGSGSRRPSAEDHIGRRDGCWDLIEVNSVDPTDRMLGWTEDQRVCQEGRKEDQLNWEESSLIKFSHFLGFST